MKPFDKERADAGDPLCIRRGDKVVKWCEFSNHIAYELDNEIIVVDLHGKASWFCEDLDLMMAPKKRLVFVNLHTRGLYSQNETKEEAILAAKYSTEAVAIAVPIEIEE